MKKNATRNDTLTAVLLLVFSVLITYGASLNADFVIDDLTAIVQNPDIGNFRAIFTYPLTMLRQFLLYMSYTIGGLDPVAFRVLNILCHAGTAIGVFFLVRQLFTYRYALIVSLLFAVHPLNTETVIWISSLPVPQYSFFLVFSLYFYAKYRKTKNVKTYLFSIGAALLSILSAEKAVVIPALLIVMELSFFSLKKHWRQIIPFIAVALVYGALSLIQVGNRVTDFTADVTYTFGYFNPLHQQIVAISSYLSLIFFPYGLTVYHYDWHVGVAEYIIRIAVVAVFFAVLVWGYFKSKPLFFWLSLFYISLIPVFIPINVVWIVAERYAYLGTVGIIAAAVYPFMKFAGNKKHRTYLYVAVGVIAVILSVRSIVRSFDWVDEDTLLLRSAEVTPDSPRALNNVGGMYIRKGDSENAIKYFRRALELQPDYGEIEYNLANTYFVSGQHDKAMTYYQAALRNNPKLVKSHFNLAKLYIMKKDYKKARYHLDLAQKHEPDNPDVKDFVTEFNKRGL